jgi:hypothetical protein
MESVYHIVTIRVNETSWAQVWRLNIDEVVDKVPKHIYISNYLPKFSPYS